MDLDVDTWCPVCDRLIVTPATEPKAAAKARKNSSGPEDVPQFIQPVATKLSRGKSGTIRLKAAAATAAHANTNGSKPVIRRNTSGAKVSAVKVQPLTKAGDETLATVEDAQPEKPAWTSTLYCSPECAAVDGQQSSAMLEHVARSLGTAYPQLEAISTRGMAIIDKSAGGPPSPAFISGSDTESSATSASCGLPLAHRGGASVPRAFEYFKEIKDDADDAWRQRERERRRSMQNGAQVPSARPFLPPMTRQTSSQSHASHQSYSGASSDSLSSLWQQEEGMPPIVRSQSGQGLLRGMTPLQRVVTTSEKITMDKEHRIRRPSMGPSVRSMSQGNGTLPTLADTRASATAIPLKSQLPRSSLSHTSLVASDSPGDRNPLANVVSPADLPPEFGSAPSVTLNLYNSYAQAFPTRDASGSSSSVRSMAFAFPTYAAGASQSRQHVGSPRIVSNASTIRSKSRAASLAAWDSFGRDEVEADNRKCSKRREGHGDVARSVPAGFHSARARESESDSERMTPTPSLRMEHGRWTVCPSQTVRHGGRPRSRGSSTSSTSERSPSAGRVSNAGGLLIPQRTPRHAETFDSSSTSTNATSRPAPGSYIRRASHVSPPTMSALHISEQERPASAPRPWNWDEHERRGGKTYALPKALTDRHRAQPAAATGHGGGGRLFYFQ